MTSSRSPNAIIIGAGPSGIALAYKLKHTLGFEDFTVYEKLDGPGGTWRTNTYPGCGCDIPTHLYSFSFNLNPNWSKVLADQPEILQYMEDTVDKFALRHHIISSVECLGAEWNKETSRWVIRFRDLFTKFEYTRTATILVSCVGGISFPRDVKFKGMENFKGSMFHTAQWDHSVNYEDKRMAVIGNGCSAAQVVPNVATKVAFVKQYARSAQWYHDRPNKKYSAFEKWAFKVVPLWMRLLRLSIFLEADAQSSTYLPTPDGIKKRAKAEAESRDYIYGKTPKKYHEFIVPTFALGCKRRIFDPNYLDCLNSPKVDLVAEGISEITEDGIISSSGTKDVFDIIVLATGFQVSQFLTPMEVIGKEGVSLNQQWRECRGAQAYLGTYVHNFPNMAIIFGPNTFPANNSALFSCEVQVDFAVKSLFKPILDRRVSVIEVKQSAEDHETAKIHAGLRNTVFAGACSNWYIGDFGRNAASWAGTAASFWWKTYFPQWNAFYMQGGEKLWWLNTIKRSVRSSSWQSRLSVLAVAALYGYHSTFLNRSSLKQLLGQAWR
ncbi:hypothetical protein BKA65DRAFT_466416 [Rhexocercosporidium sp. MPI-PUGE-AT-0058]|nr:hypothetical protein BKA65DRAFT_466416 [Rhexocercosporidium sp. MPI-PUGE-AT-0058]